MRNRLLKSRPPTLLALSFEGGQARATVVRRTNGSATVLASRSLDGSAADGGADAESAGRALRQQLAEAGLTERRCVVVLPAAWILTVSSQLPDLPPADEADLLALEAEREFPEVPSDLHLGLLRGRLPDGSGVGVQVAVARDAVARLEAILRAARLQPVSFSVALPLLHQAAGGASDALTLTASGPEVGMLAPGTEGVALARHLVVPAEDADAAAAVLARELRVTLAQLPGGTAEHIRHLRIAGAGAGAERLAELARRAAGRLGLDVDQVTRFAPGAPGVRMADGTDLLPEVALAAVVLGGGKTPLEFLPPRVSAWQQWTTRFSSRGLAYAGTAGGALAVLVLGAFLVQQVQLSRLRSEWSGMATRVRDLEEIQQRIRRYRPWFDTTPRSLVILRRLTEAFPETGDVTAKTVEIRASGLVSCSGTATDNTALLQTLERLRAVPSIADVQVDQVRGRSPMQFTFNFRWDDAANTP